MAEVVLTERFVEDATAIWSDRLVQRIQQAVTNLERFPEMGSPDVPRTIKQEFGRGVRKYVIPPFDLVYEYDDSSDVVTVYGLIPCANAS